MWITPTLPMPLMRAGRDVEKTVLSRALDLALHDRIFVYKNKTVVL